MGASLLIFLNKSDVSGGMNNEEIRQVNMMGFKSIVNGSDHSSRYSIWMRSKPTDGQYFSVAV